MDCRTVQENIGLFVDDMLSEAEKRQLLDHTASCPSCREALEDTMRIKQALGSLNELEPPEGLARSAIAKAKKNKPLFTYASVATAAAAAVIALAIVLTSGPMPKNAAEDPMMYSMDCAPAEEAAEMAPAEEPQMEIMTEREEGANGIFAGTAEDSAAPIADEEHADDVHSATYDSEKEFTDAGNTVYFVPLSLPDGTVLEGIMLTDESTVLNYRLQDQSAFVFEWMTSIGTYGLKDYLIQRYGSVTDFEYDGRYYTMTEADATDIYWEQDGNVFHVTAPSWFTTDDIEQYCLAALNTAQ